MPEVPLGNYFNISLINNDAEHFSCDFIFKNVR